MTYTKLATSIIRSTIWAEPDHVRIVWITMLALCDEHGVVEASIPGLAHEAHVPLPLTEDALARLSAPDPYSRSKDLDGRRIVEVRGGWRLVNHHYYRSMRDEDRKREADRERQRRHRTTEPSGTPLIDRARDDLSRDVTPVTLGHAMSPIRSDQIRSSSDLTVTVGASADADQVVGDDSVRTQPKRKRVRATADKPPDPRVALLDAHEKALLRHRGIVARAAANKAHMAVAAEVLESTKGDAAAAAELVDLYVQMSHDRWIAEHKWGFRWLASRLPELQAERSRRREPPKAAQIRAAIADLQVMADQGADVSEELERLRRELEQAQGYR